MCVYFVFAGIYPDSGTTRSIYTKCLPMLTRLLPVAVALSSSGDVAIRYVLRTTSGIMHNVIFSNTVMGHMEACRYGCSE